MSTTQPELVAVPKAARLTGALRGEEESDLAANAAGRVVDVHVDIGSAVKKGDVLIKLDTRSVALAATELGAQAELARTRREQARRECERAKILLDAGATSKAEYDRIQDQCRSTDIDVRAAEARAGQAAQTLADATIKAPFDGVVAARFVEPGEYVRADSPVLRMAKVERLRLDVEVPEAFIASASIGSEVRFRVSAYPTRTFSARVDRRGVLVRPATRDVVAEAPVDNAEGLLLPGMFVSVELVVGDEKLLAIPRSALVARDDKSHIFVVRGGVAEERSVAVGPEVDGAKVTVRRGLREGDTVVVSPPEDLENGRAVN